MRSRAGGADLNLDAVSPPTGDLQRLFDDPTLRRQLAVETTGCVHYLSLQMDAGPTRKLAVRQAVNYAIDRQAVVLAIGGAYAGAPATTVLSPTLAGHSTFDLYPSQEGTRATPTRPGSCWPRPATPTGSRSPTSASRHRNGRPCTRCCGRRWAGPGSASSRPSTRASTPTASRCAFGPSGTTP